MQFLVTTSAFMEWDHVRRAVEVRNPSKQMMERGVINRSNRSPATRGLADPSVMFEAPLFVGLLGVRPPIRIRLLPVTDLLDDGLRRTTKKLRVLLRKANKSLPNCNPLF